MLSLNKGESIGRIKGGKYDGKYIKIQKQNFDIPLNQQKNQQVNERNDDMDFDLYDIESKLLKGKELTKAELKHLQLVLNKTGNEEDESLFGKDGNKKEIIIEDGMIEPVFQEKKSMRMWVCAPSESGKSVFVGKMMKDFKRVNPKGKIYVFSDVKEDQYLDENKPIRIKLDRSLVERPIVPEELSPNGDATLVIFDDIDACDDKKVGKEMQRLRDTLYTRGRHENISVISTNHELCAGRETKKSLNESTYLVLFPHAGVLTDYFMNNYTKLDKNNIQRVKKLPSRFIIIHRNCPQYVLYSSGVYLLTND